MSKQFKRRNYFVDKGAQGRFIAAFSLVSLVGGVVAVFCFRYLAQKKIDATLYSMRLPDVPLGSLLMTEMILTSVITAFLVMILFVLTGRSFFVRIGGPLQKMAGSMRRIINGDLRSEVKLREDDDFQDFAVEVNGIVINMKRRLSAMKHQSERLAEIGKSATEGNDITVGQLRAPLAVIQEELKGFKI